MHLSIDDDLIIMPSWIKLPKHMNVSWVILLRTLHFTWSLYTGTGSQRDENPANRVQSHIPFHYLRSNHGVPCQR